MSTIESIYQRMGLESMLSLEAFTNGLKGLQRFHPAKRIIAICDFSKPSTEERFYVLDLDNQRLLLSSLVAHGRNSGLERAVRFSNHPESNQSSLGFYRIGGLIQSPKHGQALLLDGLEKSLNGNARSRQINSWCRLCLRAICSYLWLFGKKSWLPGTTQRGHEKYCPCSRQWQPALHLCRTG